jgi:hypothetical protein
MEPVRASVGSTEGMDNHFANASDHFTDLPLTMPFASAAPVSSAKSIAASIGSLTGSSGVDIQRYGKSAPRVLMAQ